MKVTHSTMKQLANDIDNHKEIKVDNDTLMEMAYQLQYFYEAMAEIHALAYPNLIATEPISDKEAYLNCFAILLKAV